MMETLSDKKIEGFDVRKTEIFYWSGDVKEFIRLLKEDIRKEGDKHHIIYEIEAIDALAGKELI